jgi:hypothetical protein
LPRKTESVFKSWRLDDNGKLDDLYAQGVNVSMERMGRDEVVIIVEKGKRRETFTLTANRNTLDWETVDEE